MILNQLSKAKQLQNLLKTSKPGILTSLLLGLVIVFAERNIYSSNIIFLWFITLLLVSLVRIRLIAFYQRRVDTNVDTTKRRLKNIRIGTLLSGILWGSIGIFLFSVNNFMI